MVRIVIDTNVLVSSSLAKGPSFIIVNEIAADVKNIEVCLSEDVLSEYRNLFYYERISRKYPKFTDNISIGISKLEKGGILYFPTRNFNLLSDVTDNKFLNLAFEAKANYLITGNHRDFTITAFHQTKILNPKTFCELYEQNKL